MWPGPVTTVEVLTQSAAIRGPQGPPSTRTPAQFGDHIITFLKLSAKLYTSVFHHGLKVLSLKSSSRPELGRQLCRRGSEPLGLRTEGPSQGWHPLPPTLCFLLTPQQRNSPVLAGASGQAAIMFISRTEGAGAGDLTARTHQSPFCFLPIRNHVCEPGMAASACKSITQEAEAGKTLSKEKKMISTKLTFPCRFPVCPCTWAQLASQPRPLFH